MQSLVAVNIDHVGDTTLTIGECPKVDVEDCFRPLFNVADNGLLIVDQQKND
jgi:hypothetical protein